MGSRAACVSLHPHLSPPRGDEILSLVLRERTSPSCSWGAPFRLRRNASLAGSWCGCLHSTAQHLTLQELPLEGSPRQHSSSASGGLTMLLNVGCSSTYWCRLHSMSLRLQLDSNAEFLPVQCIYREHIGSRLQKGPMAMAEPCSCMFFRCPLAVTPV